SSGAGASPCAAASGCLLPAVFFVVVAFLAVALLVAAFFAGVLLAGALFVGVSGSVSSASGGATEVSPRVSPGVSASSGGPAARLAARRRRDDEAASSAVTAPADAPASSPGVVFSSCMRVLPSAPPRGAAPFGALLPEAELHIGHLTQPSVAASGGKPVVGDAHRTRTSATRCLTRRGGASRHQGASRLSRHRPTVPSVSARPVGSWRRTSARTSSSRTT